MSGTPSRGLEAMITNPVMHFEQFPSESTIELRVHSRVLGWLLGRTPSFKGKAAAIAALARILPGNGASLVICGTSFLLDLSYRSHAAFCLRPYEPEETRCVAALLRPGDIFFDIGANWGYYSVLAAMRVGPTGLVVSVEANPYPFGKLVGLLHTGGVLNVLPFNLAMSDRPGEKVQIKKPWWRTDTAGFICACSAGKGTRPL